MNIEFAKMLVTNVKKEDLDKLDYRDEKDEKYV